MLIRLNELRRVIRQQLNEHMLKTYVRLTLTEGKVEDLKTKYPDIDVDALASQDPSQKNKYLEWMVKQMASGHRIEDLVPTITYFHKNIQKFKSKDVYSYKDLKDLENEVKDISFSSKKSRSEIKSTAKSVVENEDWTIIRPETKQACQVYGAGTRWCITMSDAYHWEDYSGINAIFYFLISKKPRNDDFEKLALMIERDEQNNIVGKEAYLDDDTQIKISALKNIIGIELFDQIIRDSESVPETMDSRLKHQKLNDDEVIKGLHDGTLTKFNVARYFHNAPESLFKQFISDKDPTINGLIARNHKAPPRILQTLASSTDDLGMKRYIAANPNTPLSVLRDLAKEKQVKKWVASNPAVSDDLLRSLINDPDIDVDIEASIATNPRTPLDVLHDLMKNHENGLVRHFAATNYKSRLDNKLE